MFSFDSLGHINVVVPDLEEATRFYQALFNASVEQTFPHFKKCRVRAVGRFFGRPRIRRCEHSFPEDSVWPVGGFISGTVRLSLSPRRQEIAPRKTNDVGGPRHVCLRVTNIDEVFGHVKSLPDVHLINESPEYRPYFTSPIKPRAIELPGADGDTTGAKEAICEIVKEIRFFYAIDRYGIEWEFEEGHADIGTG